ncbi:hypothetical protein BH24BAC1_BH24BAC1_07240 [soil metagenome]
MQASLIWIFFGYLAVLPLQSCNRTVTLEPEPPQQPVTATHFTPKLSDINVPISFRISHLEDKINQDLNGVLYRDDNLKDDNLALLVTKNGPIGIEAKNNRVYFSIPLHIQAKVRWRWQACNICPALQRTESMTFDLVTRSESQLSLTEDYQLQTVSTGDFTWGEKKPFLQIGPMKIGLARYIEPAIRQQLGNIYQKFDQELQSRLQFKQHLQQAWVKLQQPILLDKSLNAWLTVRPQEIRISPLRIHNGQVDMRIGFSSYIQTVTNGKPRPEINPVLPPLIFDNRLSDNVHIGLTGEISYLHASQLLKEQVTGKLFTFDGGKDQIRINDAVVSGSGEQLVLMLDINGKTKAGLFNKKLEGKIFLKATPYYDSHTSSIRVRDLDYSIATNDMLVQTANWLAKEHFRENLERHINLPVRSQIEEVRNKLQAMLVQTNRGYEAVHLTGALTHMEPEDIYLTPTSIKAVVHARGKLSMQIDKL